ncbi:MFS transporter [Paraburkholderia edwinii]|uniref:MFS transporter n=1 Tax=Paraburkholderia edwinii TaxID=2861782 RepID=UPI001FE61E33|nr:MFS transporter [Paraburkholderia edwinii]
MSPPDLSSAPARRAPYPPAVAVSASPCDELAICGARCAIRDRGSRYKRLALASTILGSSMAFIDGSVVNVALAALQTELHASVAAIQWVVDAYLLMLASLVLVGGALGDRYGRRRIFVCGIVVFTLASAACGLAPNSATLIAARAVQGIGAALLVPSSLSIIGAVFDDRERGRAIGIWAGFASITSALGPVAGGWLVDAFSWRAIFFLNLPIALATVVLALIAVPDSHQPDAPRRMDWAGAIAAAAGLGALAYGLTLASERGVAGFAAPAVLASVAGGGIVLIGFVIIEAAGKQPMVPLDVFQSRDFSGANLVTLLLYFGLGGTLFFLPFTLIRAHGFTATQAGEALLPIPLIIGALSRFAGGALAERFGPRLLLTAGSIVTATGFALFALVPLATGDGSYWAAFFPALVVMGLGMTLTVTPLTTTVMASVPGERTGVASGINNAVARVASLVAVAALGIVFAWTYEAVLSSRLDALHIPHRSGPVMQAIAPGAESSDGVARHDAPVAYAEDAALDAAFRAVALVCAVAALGSAMCAALMIGRRDARAD